MFALLLKVLLVARSRLRSQPNLEAENLILRQPVIVLSRKAPSRVRLRSIDRLIFVWLYRCFPALLLRYQLDPPVLSTPVCGAVASDKVGLAETVRINWLAGTPLFSRYSSTASARL
jgi:hypothetical protein